MHIYMDQSFSLFVVLIQGYNERVYNMIANRETQIAMALIPACMHRIRQKKKEGSYN